MNKYWKIFTNGLLKENPLLVIMIGLCSSLAVTTKFENGIGMGLAMTFVLVMSELIISLFRCIIMGRVESFASKRPVPEALCDALGMGLGYMWVLCGISFVREVLGSGTLLGLTLIPSDYTIAFFSKAGGGFFVFGMFIAVSMAIRSASEKKRAGGTK